VGLTKTSTAKAYQAAVEGNINGAAPYVPDYR
jgi:hypothetical protein